jgi:hypothetical protein
MHPKLNNIGAYVDTTNVLYQGAALEAGAATAGTGLDLGLPPAQSLVITTCIAGTTGTPTTGTVTLAVEASPDNSTWATANDRSGSAITLATTVANAVGAVDVDCQYLPSGTRYLRVTPTVAFTGGTDPAAYFTVAATLGGEDTLPT